VDQDITKIRFGVNSATWTDQCKIHFMVLPAYLHSTIQHLFCGGQMSLLGLVFSFTGIVYRRCWWRLSVALGAPGDGTSELPCL